MNATELRELDAWIAEHVMGLVPYKNGITEASKNWWIDKSKDEIKQKFNPTTDPAAAMEVLKKCAEKMEEEYDDSRSIAINKERLTEIWFVSETDVANGISESAKTPELAICLFAKKLFTT